MNEDAELRAAVAEEEKEAAAWEAAEAVADHVIRRLVHSAVERAERDGENWADYVDAALGAAGIPLAEEQPDGRDPWEIVRLADGRSVWLAREDLRGADKYAIGR